MWNPYLPGHVPSRSRIRSYSLYSCRVRERLRNVVVEIYWIAAGTLAWVLLIRRSVGTPMQWYLAENQSFGRYPSGIPDQTISGIL